MLNKFTLKNPQPEYTKCTTFDLIPEGVHRPLWSVMIPTYNRTKYLDQTLKSVLEQPDSDKMQIEVIDNCSTQDDPEAVVRKIGQNRISFYRQAKNVGLVANLTTCIQRARGHLIHILHDDDVVLPGFYNHLQKAFEKPTVGAAFCHYAYVDEENRQRYLPMLERSTPGILSNWLERIAVKQLIQPPAIVVRRSVYEKLGGFHPELIYTNDWEMSKRIAAHYSVWYEPQTLAHYRVHSSSATSDSVKSGENVIDTRRNIEITRSYLPKSIVDKLSTKATATCTINTLGNARRALISGDSLTTIVQIREALKCSSSLKVIGALTLIPILAGMNRVKQYVSK